VLADDKRYEVQDERRAIEPASAEQFDRLAFAMRALQILAPLEMKVVVYERISAVHIESARGLSPQGNGSYALVGIGADASREHIAYRLAELAGRADVPFVLDVLCAC